MESRSHQPCLYFSYKENESGPFFLFDLYFLSLTFALIPHPYPKCFGRVALFRCVGGQACSGRLYFDFPFVCMYVWEGVFVSVYVPARAHFFMHSVACMCLVINETFFLFLRKRTSWGRHGTREPRNSHLLL